MRAWFFATLIGADFDGATLTRANLSVANLSNANFRSTHDLRFAVFNSETVYNQWTVFPENFDAEEAALTFVASPIGDFNADGRLDAIDIEMLSAQARDSSANPSWLHEMFNLDDDPLIDDLDRRVWVKDLSSTWFGDSNLDGDFNSTDLVKVFAAGEYEDAVSRNSTWATGDWTGDAEFDSSDFVFAFQDGGYEQLAAFRAVPEPCSITLLLIALVSIPAVERARNLRHCKAVGGQ